MAPHWLAGWISCPRPACAPPWCYFDNTDGGDHDTRCCFVGDAAAT
jgi:hypothetical protein